MKDEWQFDDARNTTALTTSFVLDGAAVLRVYHDYDGGWQFHGAADQPATPDVGRIVSLECMVAQDSALADLNDLPCGWLAVRTAAGSPWKREKNNPFPTHAENGYYIEDAVWMSQYRDDIKPPPEELRNNLPVGTHVKLLFRFAAENSDRQDNQTERMWVVVREVDEDDNYVGTLENDPRHGEVLACGDTIHFHPIHIMEVLKEHGA